MIIHFTSLHFIFMLYTYNSNLWFMLMIYAYDLCFWFMLLIHDYDLRVWFMLLIHAFDSWLWFMLLIHAFDSWLWFTLMVHAYGSRLWFILMILILPYNALPFFFHRLSLSFTLSLPTPTLLSNITVCKLHIINSLNPRIPSSGFPHKCRHGSIKLPE